MSDPRASGSFPDRSADALLERDAELAQLERIVAEARSGRAALLLIQGPAGIGKSRLLAETKRLGARDGVRVLGARGSEIEREFSFGVVRQLFEPLLVDTTVAERLLGGSARAARPIFEAFDEGSVAEDVGFATLHGLYWLVVNLSADGPLLVAIDDLHWCDRPSLRFVAYLARRLEDLPVLLAATLRPAEPGADAALLAELAADPLLVSVRPAPLSQAGADELVGERLGENPGEDFATAVHRLTGGNPLLLHELAKVLAEERVRPTDENAGVVRDLGPRAASRSVLLRLARLSPEAVAVARAAAVLGDGADVRRVAALAGLSEEAAAAATGGLARAEILRAETPLTFVHPLVRAAVYEDVPPGERQRQHAVAARLLAQSGSAEEQVAAHMLAMPPAGDAWVVETLSHAARVALGRGASESAVAYLRRALAEPPRAERRAELLLELGTTEVLVHAGAAAEHLGAAYELLEEPELRGVAAEALARALLFTRPPQEAVSVAKTAIAELPPELFDLRQAIEAIELVAVHFGADDTGYGQRFERARTHRQGDGPGSKMLAAAAAWDWALTGGSAKECSDLALEALADGILLDADPAFITVVAGVVLVLADRDEALPVWEGMIAEAHRRGSIFAALGVALWRGWSLLHRGELGEAESSVREAREQAVLWGSDVGSGGPYVAGILARLLVERGDLEGAQLALRRRGEPVPGSNGDLYCRRGEVELLLARGLPNAALDAVDEYAARLGRFVNPGWAPWRTLKAEALAMLGGREEAIAIATDELAPARQWGAPATVGRTLRVIGTLERDEGLPRLEEAIAVLEPSPARLELAKALAAYGTALRLARRPTEAREPLRRALELASACEAPPLVARLRTELQATGLRPRTDALSGVGALTASERRVAALAAEGHSNRDIAQALYVTPKTVEVHLSAAYRKLGIRSRRELATALAAG